MPRLFCNRGMGSEAQVASREGYAAGGATREHGAAAQPKGARHWNAGTGTPKHHDDKLGYDNG